MKHVYLYIILAVLSLGFLSSCVKDKPTDQEILDSRPVTDLEVSYTLDGTEVSQLNFTHFAGMKTLDVVINDNNLVWNLVSNRDWCQVLSPAGKGPGEVVIKVNANDSFEARDNATLTFVAGDFRGFSLTVGQSAAAFSLSQPYFLSGPQAGEFEVKVTTPAGAQWDYTADPFLTVVPGNPAPNGEYETSTLKVISENNADPSRLGKVTLRCGETEEYIYVYQFGTDYNFDEQGHILLPGEAATVSVTLPEFMISEVIASEKNAAYEMSEPSDGLVTLTLMLPENLSDCSEKRDVTVSLRLSDTAASLVQLPLIEQDYIPAHGLVTYKGMQAFAAAVAAGEPTADWETDGVVCVKDDIDMSAVKGWTGIGTKERPFSGKFDGMNHSVDKISKGTAGLFNICNGATISNVVLGNDVKVYWDAKNINGEAFLGGIANVAYATTFFNCKMAGLVQFGGTTADDEIAYIGGICGFADAQTRIEKCKMSGNVAISSPAADLPCYAGGVAGQCLGTLTACETTGTMAFSSALKTALLGGIQAKLVEEAVSDNNSFMGTITVGGNASSLCVGGLYGSVACDRSFDAASDASVTLGSIALESYMSNASTRIYIGGFIGKAESGTTLLFKGYSPQTNLSFDQTASRSSAYILMGGMLGGCDPDAKSESIQFENIANMGEITTAYLSTSTTSMPLHAFFGGVAGFVNGKSSFTGCSNVSEIGRVTTTSALNCANSKNYMVVCGGIAGVVLGGDAVFTNCFNTGKITNRHYSNILYGNVSNGWYTACCASGILGAFDCKATSEGGTLTIGGCKNHGTIESYRGCSAGIVCYARNATITGCQHLGDLSITGSNAPNKGGIACALASSTITDCDAKNNIFCSNPASAVQTPAGILSVSMGGGVKISGCRYFGVLSVNSGTSPFNCGGIVGTADAETVVENCKFGGKINGVDINENNVADYTVGNGLGTCSEIGYWGGNL